MLEKCYNLQVSIFPVRANCKIPNFWNIDPQTKISET